MARLPSERYLMQQIGGQVILFEDFTEREIVRFDPSSSDAVAKAQKVIYDSTDLDDQDKSFAHLWSGYFYAYSCMDKEPPAAFNTLWPKREEVTFDERHLRDPDEDEPEPEEDHPDMYPHNESDDSYEGKYNDGR